VGSKETTECFAQMTAWSGEADVASSAGWDRNADKADRIW